MRRLWVSVALISWGWVIPALQGQVPLKWDLARANQVEARELPGGVLSLRTTGNDPYLPLQPLPEDWNTDRQHPWVLAFEYFCPDGLQELKLYFGPPHGEANSFRAGHLPRAESWLPHGVNLESASEGRWRPHHRWLRLDFGMHPGLNLRIRNLHLRAPTPEESLALAERRKRRQAKLDLAKPIQQYLQGGETFPARIESVQVLAKDILLEGRIPAGESVSLAEVPLHYQWGKPCPLVEVQPLQPDPGDPGRFQVRRLRHYEERDRITARWGLVRKDPQAPGGWKWLSPMAYATDLSRNGAPELRRQATGKRKGMGGVEDLGILNELVELGVGHITVNIKLTDLLSLKQRPGWAAFEHAGKSYWINPGPEKRHDRLIRFATRHGMVVSAIILVPFHGDPAMVKRLIHPEANRAGHFAMPNLTSEESVRTYEAVLTYLAQRYAQPGDPHGRISYWIMHNEVDFAWEWTNMGQQPRASYLDAYVRSMRLAYYVARRFNPHAKVFISLTHHWHRDEDPSWRSYSSRRLLEELARYSELEGDFEWGLAHHPYPQSLFKADTWNDRDVTYRIDTPYITMKNIEVLDAFMRQESLRYRGRSVRTILLSEQGFHTVDESEAAERQQAAAFVYTWHKLRALKTIESFHNHRWMDHPHEGGLNLGIRTWRGPGRPHGRKKFAWDIYKALDTPREAEVTRFALEVIGIRDFDEIPYRGTIDLE